MSNNPHHFTPETTTVWSFPERGTWATHNSKYRGNFAPQIPRNIILKYSREGEIVLDCFVGSGTTLIECRLLGRNGIGIDINQNAVDLTKEALKFDVDNNSEQNVYKGDARSLENISDNSIDLICTHPPYMGIVKYSENTEGDLSLITSPAKFCLELYPAIEELYRVLKPNRYCAILIGDTRKSQHYIPLSYMVMQKFLQKGFILKEDIIKQQHNCMYSKERWEKRARKYDFYLIMHEHLLVFRKPKADDDLSRYRYSLIPSGKKTIID